jgi:Zn-dependent M28 family amino/carboxypeptidase
MLALCLVGCVRTHVSTTAEFNGEDAYDFAVGLQSFGPRIPGTEAHEKTSIWIEQQLDSCGWQVHEQTFTYRGQELKNVLAMKHDNLTKDTILLGAHYDTRPNADLDNANPTAPVPGANDGASGVAVLLELACTFNFEESHAPIALAFFDGEDSGGIDGWDWIAGSSHFAANLAVLPRAVIIVDMVGDADLQLYYEKNSDSAVRREIWQTAAELGYASFIPEEKYAILDDHTPFLQLGIPAVDVIDFDYPYWHTTQDTLDKISPNSLEQVGRTLKTWLEK